MPFKVVSANTLDVSSIANRDQERSTTKSSDGKRKIPLKNIIAVEGYNFMREEEDFDPVELEAMADSFIEIGIQEAPKVLLLTDGTAIIVDGERRIRSAWIAHDRSPELAKRFAEIECILAPKDCTHADRLVMMLSTQSRKLFKPFKEAEGLKKLRDGYMGEAPLSVEEIAIKVNKPVAHVIARLVLADETQEMKDLALTGKVKATTIVALNRVEKDPEKRVQKVRAANSQGKRLQVKNVIHAPGVDAANDIIALVERCFTEFEIEGEPKNILLEIQSKAMGIIQIIS